MPPPLILRIIGDASSLLKTNEAATASITSVARTSVAASEKMAAASKAGADAQIAAAIRARRVQEASVIALQRASVGLTGADAAVAATVVANAQAKLDRSIGITTATTGRYAKEVKTAERDTGKLTRGLLAGSGAFGAMGRSIAFASGGFLLFATASQIIRSSIDAAQELAAAQRRTNQQLETGGKSWAQYGAQISEADDKLRRVAGFTDTELLQAFSVLFRATNNVGTSLKFLSVAADAARALNKPLAATSVALGKALGGNLSALRRLGVSIPKNLKGMEALTFVQEKFAGQARAGTTASERFHAELEHAGAVIGTELLPTFTRLTRELTNWIAKMNESGRLQRDVTALVHGFGVAFHALGDAISVVDRITGGFTKTFKILLELFAARYIIRAVVGIDRMAASWIGVAEAANAATAAETRAIGVASTAGARAGAVGAETTATRVGAGAAFGAGFSALLGRRGAVGAAEPAILDKARAASLNFEAKAGQLTTVTSEAAGGIAIATGAMSRLGALLKGFGPLGLTFTAISVAMNKRVQEMAGILARDLKQLPSDFNFARPSFLKRTGQDLLGTDKAILDALPLGSGKIIGAATGIGPLANLFGRKDAKPEAAITKAGRAIDNALQETSNQFNRLAAAAQDFATRNRKTKVVYKTFQLNIPEQLRQARADLTVSTADDVAAARKVITHVKRLIAQGKLAGESLVQGLQAEASALSTIRSAAQEQAQRVKAAAEAALERMIDPMRLEVELSREQALGLSTTGTLRKMKASAEKALRSGKLSQRLQIEAWNQIASVNQQLAQTAEAFQIPPGLQLQLARAQALGQNTTAILYKMLAALRKALASTKDLSAKADLWGQISQITDQIAAAIIPPKLQLALAREEALGKSTTATLLKMRAILYKALRKAKGNIELQTAIWQQIGQINDQLGASAQSAFGTFKQASTRMLTAGLGLTPEQRERLRARLSQLGPGQTVPGEGVGAGGYVIDPETGRPMGAGGRTTAGRIPRQRSADRLSQATANKALRMIASGRAFHEDITVKVELDGKVIATSTTRHQQRRRSRNPSQRRGPLAGTA